jgi:hypothetical protein
MTNIFKTKDGSRYVAREPLSSEDEVIEDKREHATSPGASRQTNRNITPESKFSLTLYQLVLMIAAIAGIVSFYYLTEDRVSKLELAVAQLQKGDAIQDVALEKHLAEIKDLETLILNSR